MGEKRRGRMEHILVLSDGGEGESGARRETSRRRREKIQKRRLFSVVLCVGMFSGRVLPKIPRFL